MVFVQQCPSAGRWNENHRRGSSSLELDADLTDAGEVQVGEVGSHREGEGRPAGQSRSVGEIRSSGDPAALMKEKCRHTLAVL